MNKAPREWHGLKYYRPRPILDGLRKIERSGALKGLPYKVASLRTHKLKIYLEGRQAALFCHGVSERIGSEVTFALFEAADFDIVARFDAGGVTHLVPVQLKELPPSHLNPLEQVQRILDKLATKLTDSSDLVVAIHINRDINDLRPAELRIPQNVGQIWLYGAKDRTQESWFLIGDLMTDPNLVTDFSYPSSVIYSAGWKQDGG